jgi:hypothetical protein
MTLIIEVKILMSKFQCFVYEGIVANRAVEDKILILDDAGQLDCVDRFCYLGDIIGAGGGA